MSKQICRNGILAILMFIFYSCTIQDKENAGKEGVATKFDLSDIDSGYFGKLVDTILNHSQINFKLIEKLNIDFYYEQDSFFDKQIPTLINETFNSKQHCENILGGRAITHKIRIIYFNSREKLRPFLNMAPKGYALTEAYTLLIATNDSLRAYHTHELMHIISVSQFGGNAAQPKYWIQEGLSVFADNPCMNYSIHSISANLLYSNKNATFDSLFYQFRELPDMEGYMQAGSVVQYFIEKYGMDKFKLLWQRGVGELTQIINISSKEFEKEYHEFLRESYEQKPEIDWGLLNEKGCG